MGTRLQGNPNLFGSSSVCKLDTQAAGWLLTKGMVAILGHTVAH